MTFSCRLDIVPEPWRRARIGQYGHFTDRKTRAFKNTVAGLLKITMAGSPPLEGPLWLSVTFYMGIKAKKFHGAPMGKRCDLDNMCKGILDAANGIAWIDDGQIAELFASKIYCPPEESRIQLSFGHLPHQTLPKDAEREKIGLTQGRPHV